MSDTERINNRIDTYSEAFDFYIERREMPPEIAADDQLGAYMRQVIDENPHLVSVDPLWAEVLKENLMDFFSGVAAAFRHRRTAACCRTRDDKSIQKCVDRTEAPAMVGSGRAYKATVYQV